MPIIRDIVNKKSTIYTDKWKAYDGLILNGYKHKRINHSKIFVDEEDKKNHINGIENFWGWSKNRLRKFNGINKDNFYYHIKECEFRFNYRKQNLYKKLLTIIRKIVLINRSSTLIIMDHIFIDQDKYYGFIDYQINRSLFN